MFTNKFSYNYERAFSIVLLLYIKGFGNIEASMQNLVVLHCNQNAGVMKLHPRFFRRPAGRGEFVLTSSWTVLQYRYNNSYKI